MQNTAGGNRTSGMVCTTLSAVTPLRNACMVRRQARWRAVLRTAQQDRADPRAACDQRAGTRRQRKGTLPTLDRPPMKSLPGAKEREYPQTVHKMVIVATSTKHCERQARASLRGRAESMLWTTLRLSWV